MPVGTELSEWASVADDVVKGDKDVVAKRAERLGLATASASLGEVGGEVDAFGGLGSDD